MYIVVSISGIRFSLCKMAFGLNNGLDTIPLDSFTNMCGNACALS